MGVCADVIGFCGAVLGRTVWGESKGYLCGLNSTGPDRTGLDWTDGRPYTAPRPPVRNRGKTRRQRQHLSTKGLNSPARLPCEGTVETGYKEMTFENKAERLRKGSPAQVRPFKPLLPQSLSRDPGLLPCFFMVRSRPSLWACCPKISPSPDATPGSCPSRRHVFGLGLAP